MGRSNKSYRRLKNKKEKGGSAEQYELVGSDLFLKSSIQFMDSVDDFETQKVIIKTTPTISILDSGNKILIDYSHSKNNTDIRNIEQMFGGLNVDDEFTLDDSFWQIDESDSIQANFNGTYYFDSLENNKTIVARPKTTIVVPDGISRFSPKRFEEIPQIQVTLGNSTKTISIVRNILGFQCEKSFKNLSLNVGVKDFYEIEFVGTSSNSGKLKIHEYRLAPDGSEELVLSEQIQEEIQTSEGYYLIQLYTKNKNKEKIQRETGLIGNGCCENSLFSETPFRTTEEFCINSDGRWHFGMKCGDIGEEEEENKELDERISRLEDQIAQLTFSVNELLSSQFIFGGVGPGGEARNLFPRPRRNQS
jgi:hypothetical protein